MPERIAIRQWDETIEYEDRFRSGAATLIKNSELAALVRLAKAAKAQHEWMCGDGDPDAGHAHFVVMSEALDAFDFTQRESSETA